MNPGAELCGLFRETIKLKKVDKFKQPLQKCMCWNDCSFRMSTTLLGQKNRVKTSLIL